MNDMEHYGDPDGLYFVYGVEVLPDGTRDRYLVSTVDILDVAKAKADLATAAYNYCYVKQFGVGTVYFSEPKPNFEPISPSEEPAPIAPSNLIDAAP